MAEGFPKDRLQQQGEEFHMFIGSCITVWAGVDDELFRIFQHCLGAPIQQAAIVYYRCPGLDIRLNLTDELVESRFPKPTRKSGGHAHPSVKAWRKIKTEFGNLLGTRRRIAHYPSRPRFEPFRAGISRVGEPPPSYFEIYVSETERLRSNELPPLKIDDLRNHLTATFTLRDRLRTFFYQALLKPTLLAASGPPSHSGGRSA